MITPLRWTGSRPVVGPAAGLCLAWSAIASPRGTAGSLAALLLWFSHSAQVLRLGSEFTHFFANDRRGSHLPAFVPNRETSP